MDFPLAPIPSIAVGELSVGTASTVNSRRKRAAGGAPPSPRSTKRSTYSETERSPLDRAGSDTARSSEPRSRPMCFRISNVPLTWGKEDLVEHLKRVGFVDKGHNRVSLYPACSGDGQVALLNLVEYFEWFRQLSITGSDTLPGCGSETNLQIDRHFYGLTPLNNPKKNIAADVVAVTGLAGHAYGSWKNRTKNRMWLHDFLPCEFNNIRIMTYGYDTTLQSADDTDPANVNPAKRILDLRRAFVTSLTNARSSPEERKRPIVFLGHSLGGILILQALLQCKLHSMHQDLIEATRTICFFGTPQKGLRTAELEEAVNEEPNKVANLLFQLRVGSEFLETQADDLVEVLSQCNVVTFYETVETATVTKSSTTGKWTRDGPPAIMVTKDSAQLFLPNEQRIPVSSNHSDIVKFPDPSNETYRSVVTQIKMCIDMVVRQREISRKITLKEVVSCLKSLKGTDCEAQRDEILFTRHRDTCGWLTADKRYKNWARNDGKTVLWIRGDPGCGKSVLAAFLSAHLAIENAAETFGKQYVVAYFFCNDKDERLRTPHAILASLLAQILWQEQDSFVHFSTESQYVMHRGLTVWDFPMLLRVLGRILKDDHIRPLCLLIDALDECDDQRIRFLDHLQSLIQESAAISHPKLVVTSRPHIPVLLHMTSVTLIPLDAANLNTDITTFVTAEVGKLRQFCGMATEIQETLIRRANGMFLWVSLILDDLKKSKTTNRRAILRKLEALPMNLEEVYKHILSGIEPEDETIVGFILQWVLFAMRPLTVRELTVAIAMRPDSTCIASLQDEMEQDLEITLRSLFGPMIKIEAGTVHLVHQSAKDFLLSDSAKTFFLSKFGAETGGRVSFNEHLSTDVANVELAASCLRYMSFDDFEDGPLPVDYLAPHSTVLHELKTRYPEAALFSYAAIHWVDHAKRATKESREARDLAGDFGKLVQYRSRIELSYQFHSYFTHSFFHRSPPPLHIAAYFGFTEFVRGVLDSGVGVDVRDSTGRTALFVAVEAGHQEVVQMIMDRGSNIGIQDNKGWTVLHQGASDCKETAVQLLLDQGANIEAKNNDEETALHIAATIRNEAIARFLLDRGANIKAKNNMGRTALHSAAQKGNEAIVGLLLDRGANIEAKDHGEWVPLHSAAWNGNESVVRLLLDRGANIEAKEHDGWAALHLAVQDGDEATVRLLLDRGANIEVKDTEGKSTLRWAVESGKEAMIRLLLDRGANIEAEDNDGWTALHSAVRNRKETIVGLLLDLGANIEAQTYSGETALQKAARNVDEATVGLLLDRGANIEAGKRSTVLHVAALAGNQAMFQLLLDRGANIEAQGWSMKTALHVAAENGDEAIVRLILDLGADIEAKDRNGWTALHSAARNRKESTVRLLLERGANIEAQTLSEETALHIAALDGDGATVRLLLDRGAKVKAEDYKVLTAVNSAVRNRKETTVGLPANQDTIRG